MPLEGVSCLLVQDGDGAATDAAVLERAGVNITHVRTVRDGVLALAQSSWNLVLVDPSLPDGSGYQVVAYAAATRIAVAILILSAAGHSPPSVGPFERAFTSLERGLTGAELVRRVQFALTRASRRAARSSGYEGAQASLDYPLLGFASLHELSHRQRQLLSLLVSGSAHKEIARHLALSPVTIRRHAEDIYRKCGVRNQRELLALVARAAVMAPGVTAVGGGPLAEAFASRGGERARQRSGEGQRRGSG
jgi:DNA-binding NarL/FixJ family response regulator